MLKRNHYSINIQPQNLQLEVELDQTTIIQELFEALQNLYNIQGDVNLWTCFSIQRSKFLKITEEIGNNYKETLEISTQPKEPLGPQEKNINLTIIIKDGALVRELRTIFKINDTIQDLAKTVLQYCSGQADSDVIAVDIFLFGQSLNNQIQRQYSFSRLQLQENTIIEAKIRWIGG